MTFIQYYSVIQILFDCIQYVLLQMQSERQPSEGNNLTARLPTMLPTDSKQLFSDKICCPFLSITAFVVVYASDVYKYVQQSEKLKLHSFCWTPIVSVSLPFYYLITTRGRQYFRYCSVPSGWEIKGEKWRFNMMQR